MIRKLTLPLLAALGFAAFGCEDYEAPEINNTKPGLSLSEPTVTTITDTLLVSGVATDDKYVNALGFRLVNLDENNSIDYTFKVRWNKELKIIPVPQFPFTYKVVVSNARLIAGNYRLEVEAGDVQGLNEIKSVDLTLTKPGISNVDTASITATLDSTILEIDNKWDNRKFITFRTRKVVDAEEVLTNEISAEGIDVVLSVIENGPGKADNDTLLMSPLGAKTRQIVASSVEFTKEVRFRNTTLTKAQLDTIISSRQVRREFNAGTGEVNSLKPVVGKVYALGLENNIYVMIYIKSYVKGVYTIFLHHKRY